MIDDDGPDAPDGPMLVDQLRFTLSTMGVDVEARTSALIEHLTSDLGEPRSRRRA